MTETERKALALVNEVRARQEWREEFMAFLDRRDAPENEALCLAIERHEAFRKEVSDAVEAAKRVYGGHLEAFDQLERFILPKPVDPLVEALQAVDEFASPTWVERIAPQLRAALAARGLKIVEDK